jgi:6-phosphogluconolactonase (cycloisomerase 2 family)
LIVESTSRLNSDLMVHGNTVITPTINATGFTYGAQSYNISQSTTTYGLFFKPDGTRFYTSSRGTTRIYTYNVTDPWTLSGSSYVSNSSISLQTTEPRGIYIKPDGLKAYVVSAISPTTVFQYSLNEAWGNSCTSL